MSSGKAQMYEEEALEWIERLADPVDEATLIEASKHLLPRHYDDLLLERDAEHRCGYPICPNPPKDIQSRYRIRDGMIYDQEPLKPFCSPRCYRASAVYRMQLSEEPLFLRGSKGGEAHSPPRIRLLPILGADRDDTLRDVSTLVSQPVRPVTSATLDLDELGEALEEITTGSSLKKGKEGEGDEDGDGDLRIRERSVSDEAPEPPTKGDWRSVEGMRLLGRGDQSSFLEDESRDFEENASFLEDEEGEKEPEEVLDAEGSDRSRR